MKVSEFLAQARDILSGSWTQGTYRNTITGTVCSKGACERVALSNLSEQGIITTAAYADRELEAKSLEIYSLGVISFNDETSTKHQDVLDLFDKTIIGLEEHGK